MPVFITYFVHGTTTNNELGLATGWRDGKLSALGVKQSMELKRNLKKKFDVVFCSDLGRAIETAEIVFGEFVIDKRLRECDYGDMTGKHIEDLNLEKHIYEPFPNGESLKDVEKRVSDFLEFLRKKL